LRSLRSRESGDRESGVEKRVVKTVTIPEGSEEIRALLEQARDEDVIVRMDDGSEFMLSAVDDFDHEITQHVRQTIWITPEPKWGWALGSCDMPAYEPLCDRVEVVRSVDQLAGVAEDLVKSRV